MIYYFDLKDGTTIRDRTGLEFPTTQAAIELLLRVNAAKQGEPPRPLPCQGSPKIQFSCEIETSRPVEVQTGAWTELEQDGFAVVCC